MHIRSVRVLSGQQLSPASPVSYLEFGGPDRAKEGAHHQLNPPLQFPKVVCQALMTY